MQLVHKEWQPTNLPVTLQTTIDTPRLKVTAGQPPSYPVVPCPHYRDLCSVGFSSETVSVDPV